MFISKITWQMTTRNILSYYTRQKENKIASQISYQYKRDDYISDEEIKGESTSVPFILLISIEIKRTKCSIKNKITHDF